MKDKNANKKKGTKGVFAGGQMGGKMKDGRAMITRRDATGVGIMKAKSKAREEETSRVTSDITD